MRPLQWRILWHTIRQHEEGMCDCFCSDIREIEPDQTECQRLLDWLEENGYLSNVSFENAWGSPAKQYVLNWDVVKQKLGVDPPPLLKPLSPKEINK